jgi:hypothetical protein
MGMRGYRRREEISAVSTLVLSATWNYLPRRHNQAYVLGQRWDGGVVDPWELCHWLAHLKILNLWHEIAAVLL